MTRIFSAITAALVSANLFAAGAPKNLGGGLKALVEKQQQLATPVKGSRTVTTALLAKGQMAELQKVNKHAKFDAKQRVLVNIYLDGTQTLPVVRQKLRSLGLVTLAEAPWYRKGGLSAWMPLAQGAAVGTMPGVRSVHLEPGMIRRVGQTETQGRKVIHADAVNTTYDGTGIKIGALSDTFALTAAQDKNGIPDTPAYDVANGDLPVVEDVQDFSTGVPTDEGRGMLQLIHDVAPGSPLAFATANGTQINFANNIRALGSPTSASVPIVDPDTGAITMRPGLGCRVVCDDVIYFVEPMYSDGLIAQAIDDMVNQPNGNGIVYFSSAGNDGNEGYESDWHPVDVATGLAHAQMTEANHPALTGFPTADTYSGGFQNFSGDPNNPVVVQKVTVGSADAPLVMQWNDPYDVTPLGTGPAAITTDYNILVFDSTGAYQSGMSGTDDNYATNEPYEFPGTDLTAGGTFYICIVRADSQGHTPVANRLRYVAPTNGGGFSGDFIKIDSPSIYGHTTAGNCISTAAYVYDNVPNVDANGNNLPNGPITPGVENFSSNGPVDIFFDRAGNRLTTPNHRRQPALSAPDGGNTTFFPPAITNIVPPGGGNLPPPPVDPPPLPITIGKSPADYEGDGWANFFGTSAAAPHAAAAAALILQAGDQNGLGPLNARFVRSLMQSTTQGQIDTAPGFCLASPDLPINQTGGYKVTLSGQGDNPEDKNAFQILFLGPAGYQLTSISIDLTNSGLEFDPDATHGFPFTQGDTTGGVVLASAITSSANQVATLTFTGFDPGDNVSFGVDRDVAGIHAYGNGTDQLEGSTFTATLTPGGGPIGTNGAVAPITVHGTFHNVYNNVYNFKAGYGLIDVQAAVNRLLNP